MKIESINRPWLKSGEKSQGVRNNDRSFYNTPEWRRTRAQFLTSNQYCVKCGAKAEMVDHKQRILDGGDKHNWNNLQAMCNRCHASKSARESNETRKKNL